MNIEQYLPAAVEILCITEGSPLILEGTLLYDPETVVSPSENNLDFLETKTATKLIYYTFTTNQILPDITLRGCKAIIHPLSETIPMMTMQIEGKLTNRNVEHSQEAQSGLILTKDRLHQREKRLFPRLYANITMRYIELRSIDGTPEEWVTVGTLPRRLAQSSALNWFTPEPFMNFSANGLSFYDEHLLNHSALVIIELDLLQPHTTDNQNVSKASSLESNAESQGLSWPITPSGSNQQSTQQWVTHRCLGRVVRCKQLEQDRYESAIYFEEIGEDTQDVLSALTLRIQNAML